MTTADAEHLAAELDALAVLRATLEGDVAAVKLVAGERAGEMTWTMAGLLLSFVKDVTGDPLGWVLAEQARIRGLLAG